MRVVVMVPSTLRPTVRPERSRAARGMSGRWKRISSSDTLTSMDRSISAPELARNIMPMERARVSSAMEDWASSGTT